MSDVTNHATVRGHRWVAATVTVVVASAAAVDKIYPGRPEGVADVASWAVLLIPTLVSLALCFVRPAAGVALAAVMLVAQRLAGQLDDWAYLALGIGLYAIMRSDRPRWPWLVTAGTAVLAGGLTQLPVLGPVDGAGELGGDFLVFAVVALLGELARRRRQRVEALEERANDQDRLRGLRAAAAVADERARMARELHDVLAHAVSAIVVQAGAGRRAVRQRPADAETAFTSIENTGREALDELRLMVGTVRQDLGTLREDLGTVLQDGTSPQPSITYLEPLLRDASVPVQFGVSGAPVRLVPALDLTAYRVIQESLTNVRKHAVGATLAHVCLVWSPRALEISVRDDGRSAKSPRSSAAGFGLLGMRERVDLCRGTLHAEAGPDGDGWLVRATLPLADPDQPA